MIHPAARKAVGCIKQHGKTEGHAVLIGARFAVTCAHVLSHEQDPPTSLTKLRFPLLDLEVMAQVAAWRPFQPDLSRGSDLALLAFESDIRAPPESWARLAPSGTPAADTAVVTLDYLGPLPDGSPRSGKIHDPDGAMISLSGAHFVAEGMSGTGLFQMNPGERLLGLVSGLPTEEGQTTGYAIPAEEIAALLTEWQKESALFEESAAVEALLTVLLDQVRENFRPFLKDFGDRAMEALARDPDDWREEDLAALTDLQIEIGDAFAPFVDDASGVILPAGFAQALSRLKELLGELSDVSGCGELVELTDAMLSLLESACQDINKILASPTCPEGARDALALLLRHMGMAISKRVVRLGQLSHRTELVRKRAGEPFERGARAIMACIGRRPELAPPGAIFTDSNDPGAPERIVVQLGKFWMGSPGDDDEAYADEKPQHEVRIARPFALGRYPMTFAEYDEFCRATNGEPPDDSGWGHERRPVINVSWEDATAYSRWLSECTGQEYRLPSEAEWEYACRAGTATRYPWGVEYRKDMANGREGGPGRTMPVGDYPPNTWGLFDMIGNVWEWVEDDWHDGYEGAPKDGSPWIEV